MNQQGPDEFFNRLLEKGIKPHVDELTRIVARGRIAVVVFEPDLSIPLTVQFLDSLGWEKRTVFEMPKSAIKNMSKSDHVTKAWLTRKANGRIFVITGGGTFLVNFEPGGGYSLEPGSTGGAALN
jgi:hypothetical protein